MSTPFADILKDVHQPIRDQSSDVQAAPDPAPVNDASKGETTTTTEAAGTAQPAATVDEDEGETPSPDVYGKVPLKALESERAKRQDYKSKWAVEQERLRTSEAEKAELRKQLDEARQAKSQQQNAPPQSPARASAPPNPVEDPDGYHRFIQGEIAQKVEKQRMDMSEAAARRAHGTDAVNAAFEIYKAHLTAADKEQVLKSQDPWNEMFELSKVMENRSLFLKDPTAYNRKIEDAYRSRIEAERRDVAPTLDHQPHKPPPSLAAARSSASGRAPAPPSGPAPLSALVGANAASVRR